MVAIVTDCLHIVCSIKRFANRAMVMTMWQSKSTRQEKATEQSERRETIEWVKHLQIHHISLQNQNQNQSVYESIQYKYTNIIDQNHASAANKFRALLCDWVEKFICFTFRLKKKSVLNKTAEQSRKEMVRKQNVRMWNGWLIDFIYSYCFADECGCHVCTVYLHSDSVCS